MQDNYWFSLLERSANHYDTPVVVYLKQKIMDNVDALQKSLPTPAELIFSVKANPNPTLLQIFAKAGLLFEAASTGELLHILRYGIAAEKILLGGPVKREEGIITGLTNGILAFNIESHTEILKIQDCTKRYGTLANLLIRVNPSGLSNRAVLKMGGKSSQFGVDEEELGEVIEKCSDKTSYAGLFMYAGSQYFETGQIVSNTRYLCQVAKKQRQLGKPPVRMLDFGGGFGIPEDNSQLNLDLVRLHEDLTSVFAEELPELFQEGLERVFFESGRFLIATAAMFITRVVDVKRSRGKRFIIVDGGINNLGIKQYPYRTFEPFISVVGSERTAEDEMAIVVGPTCTPIDMVHCGIRLPRLQVGDLLAIHNCGAYHLSYSPINFCGHPTPAEVLIEEDSTLTLIRERGNLENACGSGFITPIKLETEFF